MKIYFIKNIGQVFLITILMFFQIAAFAAREDIVGVGLVLEKTKSTFMVKELVPNGPAETNGNITSGDILLAIDTDAVGKWKSVDNLTLEEVVMLIRGNEGSPVGLEFSNQRGSFEIILIRQKLN